MRLGRGQRDRPGNGADHRLDRLDRHAAMAQQRGAAGGEVEHGALDPHRAGPAIEHGRDAPGQPVQHMLRRGRADLAGPVGGWPHHRHRSRAQHRQGQRMRRYAHRQRVEPRPGQQVDPALRPGAAAPWSARRARSVSASARARASGRTSAKAASASGKWQISGLKCGRPLASNTAATARAFRASAPRP